MTTDEMIAKIDSLSDEDLKVLKEEIGMEPKAQQEETAKPSKVKCKVCGFYKKPKAGLVATGVCKVCTDAVVLTDHLGLPTVGVIGRMGKRGKSTVSVVIDGKRWKVKRLSPKHSENVAKRYASKPKGYAKRGKRTGSEPKGLPTSSRIGADQHRHES